MSKMQTVNQKLSENLRTLEIDYKESEQSKIKNLSRLEINIRWINNQIKNRWFWIKNKRLWKKFKK